MRFVELLKSAGVQILRSSCDAEITRVVSDSRRCEAGACFVAVREPGNDGHANIHDGHQYIPGAIAKGCSAVVCEDDAAVPAGVPRAVVADTRHAAGLLAQALLDWPARKLTAIGLTGTNGKTTSTFLIRHVLEAAGFRPGLIGTITFETGKRTAEASNTTPGPIDLADMTAEMVAAGKTHLVMEVSSHALHQDRVAGLEFGVGLFTNLTGDHLDYHGTMEQYARAKRRLFEQLASGAAAVVNIDDPAGESMVVGCKARVIRFGLSAGAELRGRIRTIDSGGTTFDLHWQGRTRTIRTPLIGRHNVYNCLGAAGACLAIGIDADLVAAALSQSVRVPGRLERVQVERPYKVFVDYAHTDDALANVLRTMRQVATGRLIVVFGCGGDRDRTKRPRMARVAQELADRVVVTSDNPRTEDPRAILDEILAGFDEAGRAKVQVEIDRRKAIAQALAQARAGDLVLLAGKGHENYQIVGTTKHPFDDVAVAAECMNACEESK